MKNFKSIVLAMLGSTVSTLATAELYSRDLSTAGDQLLVVDSQTNLAWLTLAQTRELSVDQVVASGWLERGFSLATEVQVDTLMASVWNRHLLSLLGAQTALQSSGDGVRFRTSLVGAIAGDFLAQGGWIKVKTFEFGPTLTPPQGPASVPGDRGWSIPLSSDEPMVTVPGDGSVASDELIVNTTAVWRDAQRSGLGTGIFLVKTLSAVPEPSTWMLMGVGLVGLSVRGSRRRQPS